MAKCPFRDTEHNYVPFSKYDDGFVKCTICRTVKKQSKKGD